MNSKTGHSVRTHYSINTGLFVVNPSLLTFTMTQITYGNTSVTYTVLIWHFEVFPYVHTVDRIPVLVWTMTTEECAAPTKMKLVPTKKLTKKPYSKVLVRSKP